MKKQFILLLLVLFFKTGYSQNDSAVAALDQTEIDTLANKRTQFTTKQKMIIGGLIAQQAASLYLEYKWWWQGNYHPFIIYNDGGFNNYSLGMDKLGHFYVSYMYSNVLYELLKYGEFKEKNCLLVSAVIPFAWALSIEVGDGFSSYNFSPADLLANTLGIGYAFAQKKVPYLQNFKFKFSYFPGQYYRENDFKNWSLTADYDGHIYWLAADVHNILPKKAKGFWPKYLNLSFGYGVKNFSESYYYANQGYAVQREFFIGLDYNLNAIPIKNYSAKTAVKMIDYFHFPAPGIKKTGGGNWQFKPLLLN